MTEKNPQTSDPLRLNPDPLPKPVEGRGEAVKGSAKPSKKKSAKRSKKR